MVPGTHAVDVWYVRESYVETWIVETWSKETWSVETERRGSEERGNVERGNAERGKLERGNVERGRNVSEPCRHICRDMSPLTCFDMSPLTCVDIVRQRVGTCRTMSTPVEKHVEARVRTRLPDRS